MNLKFKNKNEIEKLRQEFQNINQDLNLDNFTNSFMLLAIDEQITKLKEKQKAVNAWFKVIKPQKLQALQSEIDYVTREIEKETNQLNLEREALKRADISTLERDSHPSEVIFYDNTKKWVTSSLKNLAILYKRYQTLRLEFITLEADTQLYAYDEKGRLVLKSDDSEEIMINIRHHIKANLEIEVSKEKLNRLLIGESENLEEDEDF
ncbi:hypothetical protein HLA87_02410 [Mycoplasma miroungigenitalium]|uniref:Uncharacterized protein n=1 Tax=Mycoplasma miroungigenitalium TaxID=754515 RepID=A0A6M4JC18_9MOLU|nr:hypothetical protein [Mycoplasma miroungigenitalium]QJR43627.1 hypothetical protein HLA87_02410 [Mycoplasma miroungigenitalium]